MSDGVQARQSTVLDGGTGCFTLSRKTSIVVRSAVQGGRTGEWMVQIRREAFVRLSGRLGTSCPTVLHRVGGQDGERRKTGKRSCWRRWRHLFLMLFGTKGGVRWEHCWKQGSVTGSLQMKVLRWLRIREDIAYHHVVVVVAVVVTYCASPEQRWTRTADAIPQALRSKGRA